MHEVLGYSLVLGADFDIPSAQAATLVFLFPQTSQTILSQGCTIDNS